MTIYSRKTKAGTVWRYDFELGGVRYTSPAGLPSKPAAKKAERERRAEIMRGGASAATPAKRSKPDSDVVTLAQACELYWQDTARHHRSARDIANRLAIVRRLIGDAMDVTQIRYATVLAAREARRVEPGRFGKTLSPTTVNRDIIDALRPALYHAARVHELALPKIDWGKLRLKERDELHCEFSDADIDAWGAQLGNDVERLFLACALTYGPRMGELFFPPSAVKPDAPGGPELELGRYVGRERRDSRKDGSLHVVPLNPFDALQLAALAAAAATRGAETIWLDPNGEPITYYAMVGRVRRAAKRAGIVQERLVHGMRHHAATAITRANGGALTAAQRLLGHKRITTTQRYANVSKADLAQALERVGRVGIRRENPVESPAHFPPSAKSSAR